MGGFIIAKDRNTFAKRSREMDKKHKADAKREARKVRKNQEAFPVAAPATPVADPPADDQL